MFGLNRSDSDAIDLLKKDHEDVDLLFKEYEAKKDTASDKAKAALAAMICKALAVHAAIEEELFYPRVRQVHEGIGKLLDEAAVEHQSLKDIIARLNRAPSSDPLFDAGVKVLSEFVKHHVKEEENEIFPKVRSSNLNLQALGLALLARRTELLDDGPTRASGRKAPAKANLAN